jgi:hypothetical protein
LPKTSSAQVAATVRYTGSRRRSLDLVRQTHFVTLVLGEVS